MIPASGPPPADLPVRETTPSMQIPVCCQTPPPEPGLRLHLALNVTDLARSVEFYRILFGVRPARQEIDYCKFELHRPPLVMSLIPQSPGSDLRVRYMGIPVYQPSEVESLGHRLEQAGLTLTWERNRPFDDWEQEAFSTPDPDGRIWRVFCRLRETDELTRDLHGKTEANSADQSSASTGAAWEHRLPAPVPDFIPADEASLDLVQLEGTLNGRLNTAELRHLFEEAHRVLRPGGRLFLHGLVANRCLDHCPNLHGLAGVVQQVPALSDILQMLNHSAWQDLQLTRYPGHAVFQWDDVELRELKLVALKPFQTAGGSQRIIYRGPAESITLDDGVRFLRGEVVPRELQRR